jgi:hypothetical protein
MKNPPLLSKRCFWDTDMQMLDYEKHSLFIIQRVLEYGLWEDVKSVWAFYGKKRIAKEITEANWLSNKTLSFCCTIFKLKKEQFKCYTKKQSNPQHWNY